MSFFRSMLASVARIFNRKPVSTKIETAPTLKTEPKPRAIRYERPIFGWGQRARALAHGHNYTRCELYGRHKGRGYIDTELVVLIVVFALIIGGMILAIIHDARAKEANYVRAYAAWVKQTDNPKHLTYDEWKLLVKAQKPNDTTTVVPMPVYVGR